MPDTAKLQQATRRVVSSLGRALTDVALYKKGHPTPAQSLRELTGSVQSALEDLPELSLFKDGGKLVVNGEPLFRLDEVPASVRQFFDRFRLFSLVFKPGLDAAEVEVLHELPDPKDPEFKFGDFLQSKGVTHIVANSETYARVEGEAPAESQAAVAAAAERPGAAEDMAWADAVEGLTLEAAIMALIKKAVADPDAQQKIFEMVMSRIKSDLEKRVEEATRAIKTEKKLVENERARTESVIDQLTDGVVTIDGLGRILMMDSGAEDLSGKKMLSLAGKQLDEAVRKEDQVVALSKELELSGEKDASGEVQVFGEDKLAKDLRASNVLVRDQHGRVVGFMMTLPAAAKFRELERMQQEFVASITHELRAPLTSIISALSILEGQLAAMLSKDQERVLSLASKNANRLVDLVAEILDFQRIQSGHMTVHPATAQSDHIVSEAAEGLKPWCQTRGVELAWEIAGGLPPVLADHRRTVQVLTNLISNAIKFTPAGGRIWVHAKKGAGEIEGFVVFSVKDTGRGIAKEDQEKIFEKFVQIAASGRRVPGAGLGLAISKYLVYLQKGKMWVESELGKGATFFFTLPMDIPPLAASTTSAKAITAIPKAEAPKPWWKRLFGG